MPSDSSPLRLLIATPLALGPAYSAALTALAPALVAIGVQPVLFSGWFGSGRGRVTRAEGTDFLQYRSPHPAADVGALALMERPAAAVLLGPEALALAAPLAAARVPLLLRQEGDDPIDLGGLEMDRFIGRAAATLPEAARLSVLTAAPVPALPFPLPAPGYGAAGQAVLILGDRRAEGVQLALALAEQRPQLTFLLPPADHPPAWLHALLAQLPNVRTLLPGEVPPSLRVALLPQAQGTPPWARLAGVLAAGVPVLGGDAPLLRAAVGAAGRFCALTDPLAVWLAALDDLMTDSRAEAIAAQAQSALLAPSASVAAELWRKALAAHRDGCHRLMVGQV